MTAQIPPQLIHGHPQIDGQQRQIFQIVGNFLKSIAGGQGPEEVGRALSSVALTMYAYIQSEEDSMARAGFPALSEYQQAHEEIRKWVVGMVDLYRQGKLPAQDFADYLVCWLSQPMDKFDAAVVKFLISAEET